MIFRLLSMLLFLYIGVFITLTFLNIEYLGYAYAGVTLLFIFDLYNMRGRLSNSRRLFSFAIIILFALLTYNAFN